MREEGEEKEKANEEGVEREQEKAKVESGSVLVPEKELLIVGEREIEWSMEVERSGRISVSMCDVLVLVVGESGSIGGGRE